MACPIGPTPAQPFDQLFNVVNGTFSGINFTTAGTGIRDFNTNVTPAQVSLNLPFAATQAAIYINLLQSTLSGLATVDIAVDNVLGPYTSVPVNVLAWTGNTCWLAQNDGSDSDGATTPQGILNIVYIGDIGSVLQVGNHTYYIKCPGVAPDPGVALLGSDQPHYPGCFGGQGVQLLATYDDGSGQTRHFVWYHGSKLVAPDTPNALWTAPYVGASPAGSPSYSISFPSIPPYNAKATAFAAVGDSQTRYADTYCFNGTCAIPNAYGSVWQGVQGGMSNLEGGIALTDGGFQQVCVQPTNVATITTPGGGGECLNWFLFLYLANDSTGQCTCTPASKTDPGSLSNFKDITGNIDYAINGVGTRDIKIDTVPGVFSVNVPGVPTEAFLYWNVIVDNTIDASTAILNGTSESGTKIGQVGNTCWGPPQMNGSNICLDCGIVNQVWRADVSAQVLAAIPTGGTFNASVTLPNVGDPVQPVATQASDMPHYPGCNGSQGIVLLVLYESPCQLKHLQVFDGAVLLTSTQSQPTYGGTDEYELFLHTMEDEFKGCGRIALAIGDAQSQYADEFFWNGIPLPQNGNASYANPDKGNLLWIGEHLVPVDNNNTITGTTTFDCLCWFLFVCEAYTEICPDNDCGPNECHEAAPFDQLYRFDRRIGNIDYVLAGVGIRDFDTNVTPAIINITVPGPVIKAYLYWNTIGGGPPFCPDLAIFNGVDVDGAIIGCCGNTCWGAYCSIDGSQAGGLDQDNQLLNKVWFADVTPLVPGSGSYSIVIPEVHPSPIIAYAASDSPHYPGCCGGQGIALLVIYQTPPNVVHRPLQKCVVTSPGHGECIEDGSVTVTETLTTEIIIWHGAKLLTVPPGTPPSIGGSQEYTIPWKTKYTWLPKINTAVGDAQTLYKDSFFYNGIPFPPQPSYFNPYDGHLLHTKYEFPPGHTTKCDCGFNGEVNTVTAFTPDDCLCWFLYVWSGKQKCITPIVSASQSFTSPPTPMMALWNPNPPDCCPVKLPCCGDICLPAKLNLTITATNLSCGCLTNQRFSMVWNKTEQKYLLQDTPACGCILYGWLYCVGSQWTLYLALAEGSTVCADGVNPAFPIGCSPFGGVGPLSFVSEHACSCACTSDTLTVSISTA